jgi:DUF1365 family protein
MSGPRDTRDEAPVALYPGKVMHARMKPRGHRFNYRVMSMLIDLDRLDEAGRVSRLLGINGRGLFSFHERDHGGLIGDAPFKTLRGWADQLLHENGVARPAAIKLLCYPRVLGYVFNPLSVFYCYDTVGTLSAVIYEVRNTFGGIHHYVRPVVAGELSPAGLRQTERKTFYVSPFIDMDMRYLFRLNLPGETLKIRILETDREGPLLAATFSGKRRPVGAAALLAALVALPLMTLKIMGAIHYEALRLWLKGIKLVPRPKDGNHEPLQGLGLRGQELRLEKGSQ